MTNTINNFPLYASLLTTDYLAAWQGSQSPSTRKVPVSALATYYAALASANTFTGKITVSSGGIAITGNSTITGTLGGLTGLTVASGGATISGNTKVTGTLESTSKLTVDAGGLTVTTGGLTVSADGMNVSGNSTLTGTLGGLTGLTVASGGATIAGNSTITGTLGGLTGLTVASGGASVTGNSTVTGVLTVTTAGTSGNQAVNFSQFNPTLGATGSVKLPGGLVLQWGTYSVSASSSNTQTLTITFTTPFATAGYLCDIIQTSAISGSGFSSSRKLTSLSTANAVFLLDSNGLATFNVTQTGSWWALGS